MTSKAAVVQGSALGYSIPAFETQAGADSHRARGQTEMPVAYAADVPILPSTVRDTWGLVANETLACGGPAVVPTPRLRAVATGRTIPLADTAALAQTIQRLLEYPPSADAIAAESEDYGFTAAMQGME